MEKIQKSNIKLYAVLVVILLSVIVRVFSVSALPEIIVSDGFEDGLSAWTGQSGTVLVQSSTVHHGDYALQASGASDSYAYVAVPSLSTVNVRAWVNTPTFPPLKYRSHQVIQVMSNDVELANVEIYRCPHIHEDTGSSVSWRVLYWDGVKVQYPGPYGLAEIDTWYSVEINVQLDSVTLWIDGVELFTATTNSNLPITEIRVGAMMGYPIYDKIVYVDCVQIADEYIGTDCELPPPPEQGTLIIESVYDTTMFSAPCFVNDTSWGDTSQSRTVDVGFYVVSWGDVVGFETPDPIGVQVLVNDTFTVYGYYEATEYSVISGYVKYSSGLPIECVGITIGDQMDVSDSNGFFNITIPTGMYDITISYPGVHFGVGNTNMSITITEEPETGVLIAISGLAS